jgi:hypothetical protein
MVSATQAKYLRAGLYRELGFVGEDIAQLSLGQQTRGAAPYRGHIKRIHEISDLLSVIGWEVGGETRDVRVDMSAHGTMALVVLQRNLEAELDALPETQGPQRQVIEKRICELRQFTTTLRRSDKCLADLPFT